MKNCFMIVDDNALVCRATALLVGYASGCPVQCCGNGDEALCALKNDPGAFACVITDFDMPGMNGLELGGHLRALAPDTKLLLMTGTPGALDDADIRRHGFECMLAKPFDLAAVKEVLRRILPEFNNSPACGSRDPYGRGISFFEGSHGIRHAVV